ncbi:MAG TPA: hypothetical protein VEO01_29095 [Pseudonocardiaceae bacterium]|nr:hypothetical protein [Pseudonocardiaceae bacterium]
MSIVRRVAVPLAALFAAVALAGTANAVIDPAPIGPNSFFTGDVNGASQNGTIKTGCAGPVQPGQKGHPVGGQFVAVIPGASSGANVSVGFTGSVGNEVTVYLETPTSTGPIGIALIGTLHDYVVHLTIPTGIFVPCNGPADVVFVPGPPSATAKSAVVHVSLISIGV